MLNHYSHEFRSPLLSITGSIELLNGTLLNAEQKQHVNTIKCGSSMLLALIEDILQFSKLDYHVKTIEETFDLNELLLNVGSVVQSYALQHRVHVQVEHPQDRVIVKGSAVRLQQVLLNLMSNAIKVSKPNDTVTVQAEFDSNELVNDNGMPEVQVPVIFKVIDSGPGIPQHLQNFIFTPFSQLSNEDSPYRKIPGTGLGLTISKKIVTALHGEISFDTRANIGTTFTVKVPLMICKSFMMHPFTQVQKLKHNEMSLAINAQLEYMKTYEEHHDTCSSEQCNCDNEAANVILAEDNVINNKVLQRLLQQGSHPIAVKAVYTGKELLDAFENKFYKYVITDYHMPMLRGDEVAKRLRELYGNTVKIILLTADAFLPGFDTLFDKVLVKPTSSECLHKTLLELGCE